MDGWQRQQLYFIRARLSYLQQSYDPGVVDSIYEGFMNGAHFHDPPHLTNLSHLIASRAVAWGAEDWAFFIPFLSLPEFDYTSRLYKRVLSHLLDIDHFKVGTLLTKEVEGFRLWAKSPDPTSYDNLNADAIGLLHREEEDLHFTVNVLKRDILLPKADICTYCHFQSKCFLQDMGLGPCSKNNGRVCASRWGIHFCRRHGDMVCYKESNAGFAARYKLADGRYVPNIQALKKVTTSGTIRLAQAMPPSYEARESTRDTPKMFPWDVLEFETEM